MKLENGGDGYRHSVMSSWWSKACLVLCSKSAFLPAYIHVSANLLPFPGTFFVTLLRSAWVYPMLTCKIFALHQSQNAKRAHFSHLMGPAHPSRPWTSLQFNQIVSLTQKISVFHHNQTAISPGSHLLSSMISLNNHSTTLKQVNEKLTTPVDVKSKSHRLLLQSKSVTDYNMLLAAIQTTKLACHTYPLTDTSQPWLVLKGIPPNVPVDEIQAELSAPELWAGKISQITKTDKTTQTLATKYPVFFVTFQPGTDVHEVLKIKKVCHCTIRWEKYKNAKPLSQCFNCQSFDHSSNFCGKSPKCVKCNEPHATWECKKHVGMPPKCINCSGTHPTNFTNCPWYQQLNFLHQRQPHIPKPTTPAFLFRQAHFPALKPPMSPPRPHKTWAQAASQPTTPMDPQSHISVPETVKSILAMFDFQKLCQTLCSLVLQLQTTCDTPLKNHGGTWCCCYMCFECNLIHNLQLVVGNTNSLKNKKSN